MPLAFLYESKDSNKIKSLGSLYNPPKVFEHGKWEQIAEIKSEESSDGQTVNVFECRYPARFFKLVAEEGKNSVGETQGAFEISTGSSEKIGELLGELAKAISEGLVEVKVK